LETILISTLVVATAEFGDKTQLLAILLAARFRAPIPIMLGILGATLVNHAIAAFFGWAASDILSGDTLRWILAVSFFAMAIWTLQTDKLDKPPETFDKLGAFLATLIAFFIIEIGDKTQVATMALAAHYQSIVLVTIGTTLGMMIANVPAVYLGEMAARKLPLVWMRRIAAAILFLMAIAAALNIGQLF
jgi:putative Ca2+/H+ antiporter (TMEM165/GDT1 family)